MKSCFGTLKTEFDEYDNAVRERFCWSLKHEWTKHEEYAYLEEVRLSVFRYIETFYNSERLHQTFNYQSPDQFESKYTQQMAGEFVLQESTNRGLSQGAKREPTPILPRNEAAIKMASSMERQSGTNIPYN